MSTLYYALFHELASVCADAIAGPKCGPHRARAWEQCYRALEHRHSKAQCQRVYQMGFPLEIEDFANLYASLQTKRHEADYLPGAAVTVTDVREAINLAKAVVAKFRTAAEVDKRAFCAFVLFKQRAD